MPGTIAMVGAGEFLEGLADVDRHLLGRVPARQVKVAVLPTAAGMEDPRAWADMGVAHFRHLGAEAEAVMVIDRSTAEEPALADAVRRCNFVYLSGGSPGYLLETLRESAVWAAITEVLAAGGVLAGCSAGAMVMGGMTRVRRAGMDWEWEQGLGLLPSVIAAPHFNRMSPERMRGFTEGLPRGYTVVGIDEHTAAVGDGLDWTVMGRSAVTLIRPDGHTRYPAGAAFRVEG